MSWEYKARRALAGLLQLILFLTPGGGARVCRCDREYGRWRSTNDGTERCRRCTLPCRPAG